MNWDEIEGKWKQVKGAARGEMGSLHRRRLGKGRGKKDQLVGRIQERYGVAKAEAERQADEWARATKAADTASKPEFTVHKG